ncbi:Pumilio RNA-binding repeat [Arabidopsis suecica]|uniref:Pumilio RNA-binding repeat n=1 Tax=Arabidopsis suecica TaxID=45249 RepID=A0A8T2GYV0_ARASU|nr:Pumilio RNA-binding repeat [Arabidopsis suecica]
MTHERGYDLASQVLNICNVHHKKLFCHITYRHLLVLSSDENGCVILKKVITIADDFLKDEFLDLIAQHAHSLSMHDLGISLIQHVLELDFTKKTTQDDKRLHELMAEFDEVLSTSVTTDVDMLHKLASKLMLDSDLFFEFVITRRGSLMIQIILGKSEEVDQVILAGVKQRFIDVTTNFYGYRIMIQTIKVFKKRGDLKVYDQILRLIGVHALYLTKDPDMGNKTFQHAINLHHQDCTTFIACGLQSHYIELSFLKHGSKIVEMLIDDRISMVPLVLLMMEIVKCDEDTLVRLATDEYGNNILKKFLALAKEHKEDFFGDLVDKLNPLLDSLRGTLGENIVAIIDSETEMVKDRIVSQGNN